MDLRDTGWRGSIGPRTLYRSQVSIRGKLPKKAVQGDRYSEMKFVRKVRKIRDIRYKKQQIYKKSCKERFGLFREERMKRG